VSQSSFPLALSNVKSDDRTESMKVTSLGKTLFLSPLTGES